MKNQKIILIILSSLLLLSLVLSISVSAEDKYKISYDQGIFKYYNGSPPDDWIKGTPPSSIKVSSGGSFVVAENTFTFRDYYFAGWKCTYTDNSGSEVTKMFQPGQTVSDVRGDMAMKAVWAQEAKPLYVTGMLYFCETALNVTSVDSSNFIGETITLKEPANKPDASYTFEGWLNKEDGTIYKSGDVFDIVNVSTTFSAVWSVNGQPLNYHTITVICGEGGKASAGTINSLSGTTVSIKFYPDEGYEVSEVKINGDHAGNREVLNYTVEDSDAEITVEFKKISGPSDSSSHPTASPEPSDTTDATKTGNNKYTLVIFKETSGGDGKIFLNGTQFDTFGLPFEYEGGEIINISYEPDENSHVSDVQVKNPDVVGSTNYLGKGNPFSIRMNESKLISIKFAEGASEKENNSDTVKIIIVIFAASALISLLLISLYKQNKPKKKRSSGNGDRNRRYNNKRV